MIGGEYWATGITLKHVIDGWTGSIAFLDDGFVSDSPAEGILSTEGSLHTRYVVRADHETALTAIVDVLLRDAERLGIAWRYRHLYYHGDGEDPDQPPPDGWRQLLAAECARIGWDNVYDELEARA
jgi:hypothetical protein